MKSKFSIKWKASKQPRKQRKYSANAPLHVKGKRMASPLSKELKKKYGMRNIEVRKGDEVKVLRGKFKKKSGKVLVADLKKTRISVDGVERSKKDGTKVSVWFNPSKVMITTLNLDDKKRMKRMKTDANKTEKEEKVGKVVKEEKETKVKQERKNAHKKK